MKCNTKVAELLGTWFFLLLALVFIAMPSDAARKVRKNRKAANTQVVKADTLKRVFIYSPDEKSGLHAAWLDSTQTWRHIGQLCASDYSMLRVLYETE